MDCYLADNVYVDLEETVRYGGPQGEEDDDDEASRKREERERKKAEVRKRLEEAGRAKNVKKGFLTPERKKKLRTLLMAKAAEDLKRQQMVKEQERQNYLASRIPTLPNIESMNGQSELGAILNDFHKKYVDLEDSKYDLEFSVRQKDFEINELNIQVNDLRGKFVKPALKKVAVSTNKFDKITGAIANKKVDFRSGLKIVQKNKYAIDEEEEKEKPQWAG